MTALLSASQGEGKPSSEQAFVPQGDLLRGAVNPKSRRKPGGVKCRLGDAEQRRLAGGSRLASVRAAGEFSQPPGQSSSAGNPAQRGVDSAVAFFLATFSWRSKKKYARRQGGTPRLNNHRASKTAMPHPDTAHKCNAPHKPPPMTPCTTPPDSPAYTPCRKSCSPAAV